MENNRRHKLVWLALVIILAIAIFAFWTLSRVVEPQVDTAAPVSDEIYETSALDGYGVAVKEDEQLGAYLTAPNGMTLYASSLQSCVGECLNAWKPYIVSASDENAGEILGTVERGNAFQQTYNGVPLYFYRLDVEEGDTNGHTLDGKWFIARP